MKEGVRHRIFPRSPYVQASQILVPRQSSERLIIATQNRVLYTARRTLDCVTRVMR